LVLRLKTNRLLSQTIALLLMQHLALKLDISRLLPQTVALFLTQYLKLRRPITRLFPSIRPLPDLLARKNLQSSSIAARVVVNAPETDIGLVSATGALCFPLPTFSQFPPSQ
jgi:hypothetical protein